MITYFWYFPVESGDDQWWSSLLIIKAYNKQIYYNIYHIISIGSVQITSNSSNILQASQKKAPL